MSRHSNIDPRVRRLVALANFKNPELADMPLSGPLRTTVKGRHVRIEDARGTVEKIRPSLFKVKP